MSVKQSAMQKMQAQPISGNHPDPVARTMFNQLYAEQALIEAERPAIEADGEAALRRLFEVAKRDSGQCKVVAKFLLGCYNGLRFPFDLTDLRTLDTALFNDCIAVLKMDARPRQEVHCYFPSGGRQFEALVEDWGFCDVNEMLLELRRYREKYGSI